MISAMSTQKCSFVGQLLVKSCPLLLYTQYKMLPKQWALDQMSNKYLNWCQATFPKSWLEQQPLWKQMQQLNQKELQSRGQPGEPRA